MRNRSKRLFLFAAVALHLFTGPPACLAQSKPVPNAELQQLLKTLKNYSYKKDFDSALPIANEAVSKFPASIEARVARGNVHRELEEDDQALSDYNWVLKAQPENVEALYGTARLYFIQDKQEAALAVVNKAIQSGKFKEPRTYMAQDCFELKKDVLRHLGRYQEAIAVMTALLNVAIRHPHWTKDRLELCLKAGQWQQAIDDATFCLSKMPQFRKSLLKDRSIAYVGLKKYDLAQNDLQAAIKAEPGDRLLHLALADVYAKAGQPDLAKKERDCAKKLGDGI
jgi:tetratricopeptide (TPR) repeat protein